MDATNTRTNTTFGYSVQGRIAFHKILGYKNLGHDLRSMSVFNVQPDQGIVQPMLGNAMSP
jgi:hypothetical protein